MIDHHSGLELVPGTSIGPFALGMSRDRVREEAAQLDEVVREFQKVRGEEPVMSVGARIAVAFEGGFAAMVEAATAGPDARRRVTWDGIDFHAGSELVAGLLDLRSRPDTDGPEFPSTRSYPDLGLVLWCDRKPAAWSRGPFMTVGVRRVGVRDRALSTERANELLKLYGIVPLADETSTPHRRRLAPRATQRRYRSVHERVPRRSRAAGSRRATLGRRPPGTDEVQYYVPVDETLQPTLCRTVAKDGAFSTSRRTGATGAGKATVTVHMAYMEGGFGADLPRVRTG